MDWLNLKQIGFKISSLAISEKYLFIITIKGDVIQINF